ncbi:beta-glucosidase [Oxalobacteraceae bacterium GrIS 2.11]
MRNFHLKTLALIIATTFSIHAAADTPPASFAWSNPALSADQRTDLVLAQMTQEEKLKMVFGYFGSDRVDKGLKRHPQSLDFSAGFVEGIPRLGIPAQFETDAGVGVATQGTGKATPREATSLPSGIATAATWNKQLAYQGGAMIGAEARAFGFNVMLAGGVNLLREPRNGRNFEYAGEDPLLAGSIVAQEIRGIESNHIISTMKHYALNDQETGRFVLNANIDETSFRMSDLLAMQFVIEQANPGSVMCSYNRVNGAYACENSFLLNDVLKGDWGYGGYVMSDWGADHSTVLAANNGLDQESGNEFDDQPFFGPALAAALQKGEVKQSRLDDMTRRILRSMFAKGLMDYPLLGKQTIDFAAHGLVTRSDAEEAIVLLKNDRHVLPLKAGHQKILLIGAHADVGVLSGGGSSQVYPVGGMAVQGLEPLFWPGPKLFFPSSPMQQIKKLAPEADVTFVDGVDIKAAAQLAAKADVAIVFAEQWVGEAQDAVGTGLPGQQEALIAAIGSANPKTVVVLETGGPVTMPWIKKSAAVLEAWYPGTSGGEAIARVLFGTVNPSGHLPASVLQSDAQLVRKVVDGDRAHEEVPFEVKYPEGAAVGYKWLDLNHQHPLFAFGFGLSYTDFAYSDLSAKCEKLQCQVSFKVTNTGHLPGKAVPQVYVGPEKAGWEAPKRLAGWDKVELDAGQSKTVTVSIDPRLLAMYETKNKTWHVAAGSYKVMLAQHADDAHSKHVLVKLPDGVLDMHGQPVAMK